MAFCGLPFPLMNCIKPSSNKDGSQVKTVRKDMGPKYSSDLRSYKSACKQDSYLKSFDSSLHQRTNSVMTSLADQAAKSQSISQGSLMEVYGYLLEMNRNVVSLIIERKQRRFQEEQRTAFVSVLVLSVVAAAVIAPQVLIAVSAGLTRPLEVVGEWCSKMWKKFEMAVKRESELVITLEIGANVNKTATENIKYEVEQLRIRFSFILETAEFAVEEEEEVATRLAMQEIMEKVEGLTEKMKEVGETAAKCSKLVALERLLVLEHIIGLPITSTRSNRKRACLNEEKDHQWDGDFQSC